MKKRNPNPQAATSALRWKRLAVFLVLILYAIPCYRDRISSTTVAWEDLSIREPKRAVVSPREPAVCYEGFVNPAVPGKMCHVSSLARAGDNRLICTWYAGTKEGHPDVAIYKAYYHEISGKWSAPELILDRETSMMELRRYIRKVGNAVVFNDSQENLWLIYATTLAGGWSTASLNYKLSQDGGQTWSRSRPMILSPIFNLTQNVKNGGLPLTGNAYLLPIYHEFFHNLSFSLLLRPENETLNYERRRITSNQAILQPAFISENENNILAFFRNAEGGGKAHILRSRSADLGRNWSETGATPLPNPHSGFDMIRLSDGSILAAINNDYRDRNDLTLVLSKDGGLRWKTLKVLEQDPERKFSYPFFQRGTWFYHLTYTYNRDQIKHLAFNETWIESLDHDR